LCPVHTGNDILIEHTKIVENQQESICAETGKFRGRDKAYLLLFSLLLEEWEWRRTSFNKKCTTLEGFPNATITGYFRFLFQENSVRTKMFKIFFVYTKPRSQRFQIYPV